MRLFRSSGRPWGPKACASSTEVFVAAGHPLQRFASELEKAQCIWVAYSGGLDSSVLLDLVVEIVAPTKLRVLHINHGLHEDAGDWQKFCRLQCERLGVAFESVKVELDASANVEERAREERYRIFEQKLVEGSLLLTAHHANDQAETVLFRMMRGAGLRGLAGMPTRRPLGQGFLLRPLISLEKAALLKLARERGLQWVEDTSNENPRFSRNFLRSKIIPDLEKHWPAAVQKINQSALAMHEANELLEQYAYELSDRCGLQDEALGVSLDLLRFNALSKAQRQLLLRQLLAGQGVYPETSRLDEALAQLYRVDSESRIRDKYEQVELGVFKFRLYLLPPLANVDSAQTYEWDASSDLVLPGVGVLPASEKLAALGTFEVGFRQGGERVHPIGREHSHSLKKLLQECNAPPWIRERSPLIYLNGELIAVAGLFSCLEAIPPPQIEWREDLLQASS